MDEQVKYWLSESKESYDTAQVLYANNKPLEAAFFCHLAVEKILKSIYAFKKKSTPPKIHNLLVLAEKSDIIRELSKEQLDFLAELNSFQLEARYPTDREKLFYSASKETFSQIMRKSEAELKWFEQKLKSNK